MQPLHRRLTRARLIYHLGPRRERAAQQALASGAEVVCAVADPEVVARLGDGVHVLPVGAVPGFEDGVEDRGALDWAAAAAEELARRRPRLVRQLAAIAGVEDLHHYLARSALRDVGSLLGLAMFVASPELERYDVVELDEQWPRGDDFAFFVDVARERGIELRPSLAAALDRIVFRAAGRARERRAKTAARALSSAGILWGGWLRRLHVAPPALPRRPLLLRTYVEDWGLDRGGQRRLRNLDFVVDGETLRPDEVAVWAEADVPRERDALLADRGYAVLRGEHVRVGPVGFLTRVLPRLCSAAVLAVRLATAERWWQEPSLTLLSQSLLWDEVARAVRPRAFVFYNDIHPSGVARTFALRRAGCPSVQYEYSSGWALDARGGWVPDFVYAFNVVDAMVTWGPMHTEHLLAHRGAIGACWETGCLWSEHARLVREEPDVRRRYLDELRRVHAVELRRDQRVVAVFDTSAAPRLLGHDDLVAFYEGVVALARELPDALVLCKPKRPLDRVFAGGRGGPAVRAGLETAPNVVLLDELFESGAVIGLCDVSVCACYTSPAIETIGAGRPSLYFDPTRKLPEGSLPRRIPGFVAAGADELVASVTTLLGQDERQREADLRDRFSQLEGHFDGLAITRFRQRLRETIGA